MASILSATHCKNVRLIFLLTRSRKESERGQFENFVRQSSLSRKIVYQQCFVNASTAAAAMALSAISPEKNPRKNRLATSKETEVGGQMAMSTGLINNLRKDSD